MTTPIIRSIAEATLTSAGHPHMGRYCGALLQEQKAEWAVPRARYMTLETKTSLIDDPVINLPAVAS